MNKTKFLNKKYKILEKIGNGKFGIVYKGINQKTNEQIAIKTENRDSPIKLLKNETTILKYLYDHGSRSTPIIYWYGVDNQLSYLVMSYFDISLYEYCNNQQIPPEKIDKIMCVCIDILETIHKQYVIHRDIKPQNFMLLNQELFLIDFGFSTFYVDEKGEHLHDLGSQNIIGTPKYISYNIHNGCLPSRRDDLISLGYIYLYLYCRELPWDSLKIEGNSQYDEIHILHYKNQQRKILKEWENLEEICKKTNEKITNYLNYCYKLQYACNPNYNALKGVFNQG
jgi:serine/threonine protein kinase